MDTDKINEILRKADGIWGAAVKPIGNGFLFEHNANGEFRAASVGKVPIALYLLYLVETNGARLEDRFVVSAEYYQPGSGVLSRLTPGVELTLKDLVVLMLTVSDNTAADLLVKAHGADKINNYLTSLGFQKTQLGIKDDDFDFGATTPREMAVMLEGIYSARYLNREHSDLLLQIMKECENQLGIKRLLPYTRRDGAKLETANKGGSHDRLRNDIGIVFTKQPYVIAIFSKDLPMVSYKPDNPGWLTIARLSAEVYAGLGR
ncbi:MAG: hypothetical protein B7X04_00130 [Parcubacteria group bacterium 21-54-25]|nr:MAG: hypothetical protein B7X04_00130 [Parcubacteria group bacterium 21-54-25]HQU07535.1 class A beta-lactamase-related serine hydrolase [Candidatus Paceibacterota bacterium]